MKRPEWPMEDPYSAGRIVTVEKEQWRNLAERLGWSGTEDELLAYLQELKRCK